MNFRDRVRLLDVPQIRRVSIGQTARLQKRAHGPVEDEDFML